MKTLTLVRHCKSDWSSDELADHERPLNQRGMGDIPLIASRLNELNLEASICYHSSAKRAVDTAQGIVKLLKNPMPLEETDDLYTFDYYSVLSFIHTIPNEYKSVVLVGHNPGLTELINLLGDVQLDNLPTGGFCQFKLFGKRWEDVEEKTGEVSFLEYPKLLK